MTESQHPRLEWRILALTAIEDDDDSPKPGEFVHLTVNVDQFAYDEEESDRRGPVVRFELDYRQKSKTLPDAWDSVRRSFFELSINHALSLARFLQLAAKEPPS